MIPKRYRVIFLACILYLVSFLFARETFHDALALTGSLVLEMVQILPPVMVITALITVWIPSETIRKGLGTGSGIRGTILSLLIGSLSAGPIYAAFPAAVTLLKKGASVGNIVIILSSWAVIKLPMFFVESSFLGVEFASSRMVLTIPAIIIMGVIMERVVRPERICSLDGVAEGMPKEPEEAVSLPNLDCGGCGYRSCEDLARAINKGIVTIDSCVMIQH